MLAKEEWLFESVVSLYIIIHASIPCASGICEFVELNSLSQQVEESISSVDVSNLYKI